MVRAPRIARSRPFGSIWSRWAPASNGNATASQSPESARIELDAAARVVRYTRPPGREYGFLPAIKEHLPLTPQLAKLSPMLEEALDRAFAEGRPCTVEQLVGQGRYSLVRVRYTPATAEGPHVVLIRPLSSDLPPAGIVQHALQLERYALLPPLILSRLNQDLDLRQAAQGALPLVVEGTFMEAGGVFVLRGKGDSGELLAAYGRTKRRGFPYADLDLRDPIVADLLQRPRIRHLAPGDQLQDALDAVTRRDFGTAVLVPCVAAHTVNGFLLVTRRSAAPLLQEHANLLMFVGEALGLAFRNHTLSSQTRQSAAMLETAYTVSRAISRSLDLEQTFREIALNVARMVGGCHCLLLETEPETEELVVVASSESEGEPLEGLRVRFDEAAEGAHPFGERRSILVEDLVWGARVSSDLKQKLDFKSVLFLPMFAQGKTIGSLVLYSTGRRRQYTREEIARAEDVAEQAAIAIQNARLYRDLSHSQERVEALLSRIARVREQERQTFARLLHDDVVQSIVGSVYHLEALEDAVDPAEAANFDHTMEVLRGTVRDARQLIWELRPPVLDELGLAESVRGLAQRIGREMPARITCHIGKLPDLPRSASTAVYKIAREALLNARRHADARSIAVVLRVEDGAEGLLYLRICDDGKGFDPDQTMATDHYGLVMMEEQAALVGGSLTLCSSPGKGAAVEVTIPLELEA